MLEPGPGLAHGPERNNNALLFVEQERHQGCSLGSCVSDGSPDKQKGDTYVSPIYQELAMQFNAGAGSCNSGGG